MKKFLDRNLMDFVPKERALIMNPIYGFQKEMKITEKSKESSEKKNTSLEIFENPPDSSIFSPDFEDTEKSSKKAKKSSKIKNESLSQKIELFNYFGNIGKSQVNFPSEVQQSRKQAESYPVLNSQPLLGVAFQDSSSESKDLKLTSESSESINELNKVDLTFSKFESESKKLFSSRKNDLSSIGVKSAHKDNSFWVDTDIKNIMVIGDNKKFSQLSEPTLVSSCFGTSQADLISEKDLNFNEERVEKLSDNSSESSYCLSQLIASNSIPVNKSLDFSFLPSICITSCSKSPVNSSVKTNDSAGKHKSLQDGLGASEKSLKNPLIEDFKIKQNSYYFFSEQSLDSSVLSNSYNESVIIDTEKTKTVLEPLIEHNGFRFTRPLQSWKGETYAVDIKGNIIGVNRVPSTEEKQKKAPSKTTSKKRNKPYIEKDKSAINSWIFPKSSRMYKDHGKFQLSSLINFLSFSLSSLRIKKTSNYKEKTQSDSLLIVSSSLKNTLVINVQGSKNYLNIGDLAYLSKGKEFELTNYSEKEAEVIISISK